MVEHSIKRLRPRDAVPYVLGRDADLELTRRCALAVASHEGEDLGTADRRGSQTDSAVF
jgi:hypothetical protein